MNEHRLAALDLALDDEIDERGQERFGDAGCGDEIGLWRRREQLSRGDRGAPGVRAGAAPRAATDRTPPPHPPPPRPDPPPGAQGGDGGDGGGEGGGAPPPPGR